MVIKMKNYLNSNNYIVLGLHGKMDPQEQKEAFQPSGDKIKIIFATRVAETSITIDMIKVVVDPGQDNETIYDQNKKISSYRTSAISRSAAKQRAGRAGRTQPGICFKLYSQEY